jgi:hypothetical protein
MCQLGDSGSREDPDPHNYIHDNIHWWVCQGVWLVPVFGIGKLATMHAHYTDGHMNAWHYFLDTVIALFWKDG